MPDYRLHDELSPAINLIAVRKLPENRELYVHELARLLTDGITEANAGNVAPLMRLVDSLAGVASTAVAMVLVERQMRGELADDLDVLREIERAVEELTDGADGDAV